ncbi:MAG: AMIN domain-containing protein [bacterium]
MRRTPFFSLAGAALCLVAFAAPAGAQEGNGTLRTGPYLGVQPGQKDDAPGKVQLAGKGGIKLLTWVGFQMVGEGGRVFLQTSEAPTYQLVSARPDEVVLELTDTKLHRKNDGRPLKTGWFPTAVREIDADPVRGDKTRTRVTIRLREQVGYDLRQEGNYLILDFRAPTGPVTAPPIQ